MTSKLLLRLQALCSLQPDVPGNGLLHVDFPLDNYDIEAVHGIYVEYVGFGPVEICDLQVHGCGRLLTSSTCELHLVHSPRLFLGFKHFRHKVAETVAQGQTSHECMYDSL